MAQNVDSMHTVVQTPYPGECTRRLRFLLEDDYRTVHVIIEEEDHSGDGLFEDERSRISVPLAELVDTVNAVDRETG